MFCSYVMILAKADFKIENASLNDMHWTGDVPDYVSAGTNGHVVARIDEYNSTQQLLFIEPIMMSVR